MPEVHLGHSVLIRGLPRTCHLHSASCVTAAASKWTGAKRQPCVGLGRQESAGAQTSGAVRLNPIFAPKAPCTRLE